MPVSHVRCCDRLMTVPEALEHVVDGTNACEWTYELLAAMMHSQTEHPSHQDGTRISTTVLTNKCVRRIVFERQSDWIVEPADLWALFRGTMFHRQLEQWAHPQSYAEARFYVEDLGSQIDAVRTALPRRDRSFSGSPDLVNPTAGILYDYKRCKEVPRFQSPWQDHVAQLNINRWLVDNADTVKLVETNAERKAALFAGAMPPGLIGTETSEDGHEITATWDMHHEAVRARFCPEHDWQDLVVIYVDDKGPKPLRCLKSIDVPKVSGKGTKRARVSDIWEDAKVERYIAEHYVAARRAFLDGVAPIPDGWEHQSHALCVRCPMRRACAEKESKGQ